MSGIKSISTEVERLVEKYGTRDPFELCKELNIKIRYMNLGNYMKAYFFYQSRIKNIIINSNIVEPLHRILVAHELGHALLHCELAMMNSIHEFELFDNTSKTEYEANLFAAELLIEDNQLLSMLNDSNKSFFDVARELYVPAELLDFKFRVLKNKSYRIEVPVLAKSDFLKADLEGCYGDRSL
jgi:Zn-dependent peptidase ImmA (M78 family)